MGKQKDLSDFDKGQIVKARQLSQSISNMTSFGWCSGLQWLVSNTSGARKDNQWTGIRVMGTQCSSMYVLSKD